MDASTSCSSSSSSVRADRVRSQMSTVNPIRAYAPPAPASAPPPPPPPDDDLAAADAEMEEENLVELERCLVSAHSAMTMLPPKLVDAFILRYRHLADPATAGADAGSSSGAAARPGALAGSAAATSSALAAKSAVKAAKVAKSEAEATARAARALPFFSLESIRQGAELVLLGSEKERPWFNVFLVFVPMAILSSLVSWPPGATFVLSLLAMLPLAERLGFVTEELAEHVSETIAGLMNASMGNAPELIIAIFALAEGQLRVVQVSLLGSVLSNLLLVLGTGLLIGGIKFPEQRFTNTTSSTSVTMLLCGAMSLLLPTLLHSSDTSSREDAPLLLSRVSSLFMLGLYVAFLVFQLKTHAHLFEDDDDDDDDEGDNAAAGGEDELSDSETTTTLAAKAKEEADGDEEDDVHLSFWGSVAWLAGITAIVAYVSELLVGSIKGASKSWNLPEAFISCILLPVAGNAAEHASAIIFAYKNRLDVTLGIAVGSATQISMFVIPLLVVIGWCINQSLSLDFQSFEVGALILAVLMSSFVIVDGRSHWLQGSVLLGAYAIVAVGFAVHEGEGDAAS